MKRSIFFVFTILVFFLVGCNSDKTRVQFTGELEENIESTISLYKVTPDGSILIDSAPIEKGKFKLRERKIKKEDLKNYPAFYKISLANENLILTVASPGEKIHIKANAKSLVKTYTVTGGKDAVLMHQLDYQLKLFVDSTEALQKIYEVNQYDDAVKTIIEAKYDTYIADQQQFLLNFIEKNPTSLTTLTAFYQKFNRRVFLPENENLPLLITIGNRLESQYPENENIIFVKERIKTLSTTKGNNLEEVAN